MKKIITPYSEYPNALELENGNLASRHYLLTPTPNEVEFLHAERLDKSDSIAYTIDTLIVAIFAYDGRYYWKFGCGFCDRESDLEALERYQCQYFRAFLEKYNRGHLSTKGLNWLFDYYMKMYNFNKGRL